MAGLLIFAGSPEPQDFFRDRLEAAQSIGRFNPGHSATNAPALEALP